MTDKVSKVPSSPLGEQSDGSFRDPALEYPDPTPCALPIGAEHPEPIGDMIRRLVRNEISREAAEAGDETFEEANDFEVDEDPDTGLFSPYERLPLVEERPVQEVEENEQAAGSESAGNEASEPRVSGDAGDGGGEGSAGVTSSGGGAAPVSAGAPRGAAAPGGAGTRKPARR